MKYFFHDLEIFISKEKRRLFQDAKFVSWNIVQFVQSQWCFILTVIRSSQRRCSVRKGVLRNFAKSIGKQLCQSLYFNKVAGLLRTPFLKNTSGRLLLDHDHVTFIKRINNFHFHVIDITVLKSCLKSVILQLLFTDFPKVFSKCVMFVRDRRNIAENLIMAALVTINSILDNAGVLDPLLNYIFKNWQKVKTEM